ncbi:MAG TPA: glycosyltransferase family 4 protein [Pyrinomonadaceae bacterium]|jgi:glycosyltransferase involved in cell wall biosynthesis
MKVLHILDSLGRGGTEVLALDLCRNARAAGLDLILAATGGGALETEFRRSGVEFVRLKRRLPVDLLLAAQLRALIRRHAVAVVHTHQAVEALHAYLATRGAGVRQVMSFHLCAADAKNRRALKFLAPRMDANIAVSRDLLACLGAHARLDTACNFRVVYNGVDEHRLKPAGGNLRAELKLAPDALLAGMVGNFYADGRKDQLTVCRALPQLFAAAPHAHFVFVGAHAADAPQVFDECVRVCQQQGIAPRVHFLGQRADVPDILRALDLFVFSSRADSFGLAVVEAMLTGVPAVVSDIGALREVTAEGRYAVMFRTGDADELAQRLIELANDRARRAALGARGRVWAAEQFGIAAHITRLRELYAALAGMP